MISFLFFWCFASLTMGIPLHENGMSKIEKGLGGRIVGGLQATRGQFPFLAALRVATSDSTHFCGGTLLNTQWIITAGHCVDGALSISIHLGSTYLEDTNDYVRTLSTGTYVIHPDYNPDTLENDLALVQFRIPISLNDYIKPINRLPGAPLSDGSPVVTMGWGQISDSDPEIQNDVHYITVTTLSNDDCKTYYGNQIVDSMVCAALDYNGGICYGDTGGPLVQYISRFQVMLVGVSSFISKNGCESSEPSGFIRIFNYNDWIKNITGLA